MNELTVDTVSQAVPKSLRTSVDKDFVDKINTITNDPLAAKHIRENFITYSNVLTEGKYKLEDYLHAVTYATYKVMGLSNQDSYIKTFPNRYQKLCAKGATNKDVSAYVAAFHRSKLVQSVLEKTVIPFWLYNIDARQQALNTQVELMINAKSEQVRTMAADSVLKHTAEPVKQGPLLNVNINKSTLVADLEETIAKFARLQKNAIQDKVLTPKDIAEQEVIDAEVIEDEPSEENS